ncbi:MAG: VWA domain-containing protein [Terriglobia bacterium]
MRKFQSIFLVILWLMLALDGRISPQTAQSTESDESVYTLSVYQDLVLVDVVVADKNGAPIKNLTRENFTISEDKVPQRISTFDFEDLSVATQPSPESVTPTAPSTGIINLSKMPQEQIPLQQFQHHRLLILYFDLSSMPVEDLIQAQSSARKFIEKQLTPADLVAIVVNASSLKVLQNFTNDPRALSQAVQKLNIGDSASLAELGVTTADDATTVDVSDSFTADETQYNIFNTDRKLSAIEAVGKMFRFLPEKKFLIYYSSGISTTGVENQSQIRATVDALNQSATSLYAVDARGLIAAPPGGDASQGSASGNANYSGKAVRDQYSAIANAQETLTTLASDTGGKALMDTNNLGQVFEAVQRDSMSYYLVGYNSTNLKRDGKFRRIKVEINIPGARLKFRQGYFAPTSFTQFSRTDKERHLEEVVAAERPFSEIPFLIATNFVRASPEQVYVPVSLRFNAADIPFEQKGKKTQGVFDFIGQVRGAKNSVISAVRDTIRIDLDSQTFQKFSQADIQYQTGFYLRPGKYDMKFLLRENQTGKLSTFEQILEVPDFNRETLSISSIILSNHLEPADQKGNGVKKLASFNGGAPTGSAPPDPLNLDGNRLVPSVAKVFAASDHLYIYFQLYVNTPTKTQPHLTASLTFYKEDKVFRQAGKLELDQYDEGSKNTVTCQLELPLTQFVKGDYALHVEVGGPENKESLEEKTQFAIR